MAPSILLLHSGYATGTSMSRYARELHRALCAEARDSRIITLDDPSPPQRRAGVFDRARDAVWRYVTHPRRLRGRRGDVFHILDHSNAHFIRQLDADRTVVTCHDLIPLLAAEKALPVDVPVSVARTFRWRVAHLSKARTVIAVSHATKAALESYAGVARDRIVVVPQGITSTFRTIPDARADVRAAAGIAADALVILQVDSGSTYKNTGTLLRAVGDLRVRSGGAIRLVRVGAPLNRQDERLAVTLGLEKAIVAAGRVDDETLARWYNSADVLAFPSWWEGFGWPVLEAMACGTPVVSSDVPSVAEFATGVAALVEPGDARAMADALERVLTDRAVADAMRRHGQARAVDFTWERTARETLAVYDSIIRSS